MEEELNELNNNLIELLEEARKTRKVLEESRDRLQELTN